MSYCCTLFLYWRIQFKGLMEDRWLGLTPHTLYIFSFNRAPTVLLQRSTSGGNARFLGSLVSGRGKEMFQASHTAQLGSDVDSWEILPWFPRCRHFPGWDSCGWRLSTLTFRTTPHFQLFLMATPSDLWTFIESCFFYHLLSFIFLK